MFLVSVVKMCRRVLLPEVNSDGSAPNCWMLPLSARQCLKVILAWQLNMDWNMDWIKNVPVLLCDSGLLDTFIYLQGLNKYFCY